MKSLIPILSLAFALFYNGILHAETDTPLHPEAAVAQPAKSYIIEISISATRLTLYEKKDDGTLASVKEYPAATAVRGLAVFPMGGGRVTRIEIDPWWRPTAYTRQIFRERGIELPSVVPPGHRLNYMGEVKISLSHRTVRGNIYRIHGNNDPSKIGKRVTGGCVRLYNEDIRELAKLIKVGTEVYIVP